MQAVCKVCDAKQAPLLDAVEDNHGPWVADSVLAALRSVAGWYVTRHDTYRPPFVGKMARVKREDRRRDRILTDDELRAIWQASGKAGVFGALVRLLLLTAQRRDKVATMKWSDISPDGTWTIATERGEKGNAGSLKLPQVALDIIAGQPRLTRGSRQASAQRLRQAQGAARQGFRRQRLHLA
jgi:integrase